MKNLERVEFKIHTRLGPSSATLKGYRLSMHFVADKRGKHWTITHEPSGLHALWALTLDEASDIAKKFERALGRHASAGFEKASKHKAFSKASAAIRKEYGREIRPVL